MRVNLTIDVDAFERYVIAQYYGAPADKAKPRRRASRAQVRQFVRSALRTSVLNTADDLPKRKRSASFRLRNRLQPVESAPALLTQHERQREFWFD